MFIRVIRDKKESSTFQQRIFCITENHDYDFAIAMFLFFVARDFMAALGFVEPVGFPCPLQAYPQAFATLSKNQPG